MPSERTDRYDEKASRSRVLRGYQRKGKLFIPPLLQIPNTEESTWLDDRLPELIWIALLNRMCGFSAGTLAATSLAKATAMLAPDTEGEFGEGAFGAVSDYASLSKEEQTLIRAALHSEGVLPKIRLGLAALINHYPDCPFAFFTDQPGAKVPGSTLADLKQAISEISDRNSTQATFAQTTYVYILLINNKLQVAPGLGFENLEAVRDYPETAESQEIGAIVRSVSLTFLNKNKPSTWRESFWIQGRLLESCEVKSQ